MKKEKIVSRNPKVINEVLENFWHEVLAASSVNNTLTHDVDVNIDPRVSRAHVFIRQNSP